jgi:hypothetical protein
VVVTGSQCSVGIFMAGMFLLLVVDTCVHY